MSGDELQGKIKKYYAEYFDPSELLVLFGDSPFNCREFAFESFQDAEKGKRKVWRRNLTFDGTEYLIAEMSSIGPRKAYFGALYDSPLTGSVKDAKWVSATLKADIDIDAYSLIRKHMCECKGKEICNACFGVVLDGARFFIDALEEDFGYKDPLVYFSGSRGVHIHYPSIQYIHALSSELLEHTARESLMYNLNIIKEEEDEKGNTVARILHSINTPSAINRVERMVIPLYLQNTPIDSLKETEWKNLVQAKRKKNSYRAKKVAKKELEYWLADIRSLPCKKFDRAFAEQHLIDYDTAFTNALLYRYPRYDASPTTDTKKVIKIPRSVDATYGYLVQKIDIDNFSLDNLETIDNYV